MDLLIQNLIEKSKALKKKYPDLNLVNWGETDSCDIIINATSLGLKDEEIRVDFAKIGIENLNIFLASGFIISKNKIN